MKYLNKNLNFYDVLHLILRIFVRVFLITKKLLAKLSQIWIFEIRLSQFN